MQPVQKLFSHNYNNNFYTIKNDVIENAKKEFANHELASDIINEIIHILNTYDGNSLYLSEVVVLGKSMIIEQTAEEFIKQQSKTYGFNYSYC